MGEFNPYEQPRGEIVAPQGEEDIVLHPPVRRPVGNGMNWITEAWGIFTANWGLWIGGTLVIWLIGAVSGMVPLIGPLAQMVIWPVLYAGVYHAARNHPGGVRFEDFFAGFRLRTGPLLMLGVVSFLVLILAMLAGTLLAWLILGSDFSGMASAWAELAAGNQPAAPGMSGTFTLNLILVGLIYLALLLPWMAAVWFAIPLVLFSTEFSATKALGASLRACVLNFFPLVVYGLVLLLLTVVAMIPFGLGLLVLWPVMIITGYTSFRDIFVAPAGDAR